MPARPRPNDETNWPTPDEIAERAASIRSQWSPRQLRTRAGLSPDGSIEISLVSLGALDGRRVATIDFN